jgi:hypothetical protein
VTGRITTRTRTIANEVVMRMTRRGEGARVIAMPLTTMITTMIMTATLWVEVVVSAVVVVVKDMMR